MDEVENNKEKYLQPEGHKPKKEPTLDDFGDMFSAILKAEFEKAEDNRPLDEIFKSEQEYWALISPHLGKTREQLEQDIPDGAYTIDSGAMCLMTGKGGLINVILAQQEEINKYKK